MRSHAMPAGLVAAALLAGCASDGTSPERGGRNLGILQMARHESAATSPPASSGPASEFNGSISWDLPPGPGTEIPYEILRAPRAVLAGTPFPLIVYTIGPNGCWSADGMDVAVGTTVVELTPWDYSSGADTCTMMLQYLRHDATLTLEQPGEWTLRVDGRRIGPNGATDRSVRAETSIVAYDRANVPAPSEVQMAEGDELLVDGVLRIRFEGVDEDSRCPLDVQCVWQGNAAVRFEVGPEAGSSTTLVLNTGIEPEVAEVAGYRIRLLDLEPVPLFPSDLPFPEYRAILAFEALPAP